MPPGQFENHADDEVELSPSQILERVKPDHITITKPDEDRRRRTIIVEKKNGSYGFTLQSYGIHYKKEQEIEVITYVDHVDYDGPAFRAGMREGDVILSINGHDMEKVDHKSLVNFIKSCDSRMRMVVLFEDCVRKVELHMRYLQLQRALQLKTEELERLCLKEKELLTGKWKTHSLPARKKGAIPKNAGYSSKIVTDNEDEYASRPTVSTEDVAQRCQKYSNNSQHFLITYQHQPPYYIDSRGRAYYLHPTNTAASSKEYLVSIRSSGSYTPNQRSASSHQCSRRDSQYSKHSSNCCSSECKDNHLNKRNSVSNENPYYYGKCQSSSTTALNNSKGSENNVKSETRGSQNGERRMRRSRSYHQQICGSCIAVSPQDNVSLEAYDLASSPCCNSRCVPTRSRRSRNRHQQHKIKSSSSRSSLQTQSTVTMKEASSEGYSSRSTQANICTNYSNSTGSSASQHQQHKQSSSRFSNIKKKYQQQPYSNLVSQCSLHSCTSSEIGPASGISQIAGAAADQSTASYTTSLSSDTLYWDQYSSQITRKSSVKSSSSFRDCQQEPVKPVKSWDNLTTSRACADASCGDFTYEYLGKSSASTTAKGKSSSSRNIYHQYKDKYYVNTTKSSESLLFYSPNLSDASLSCECIKENSSPTFISENGRFVAIVPAPPSVELNVRDKASQTDGNKKLVDIQQTPEITRL